MFSSIGKSVRRKEDLRFVTGSGEYTADIDLPGQRYLHVHRAPVAHANIVRIDTSAAAAAEGVVAVITAEDLSRLEIRPLPCGWPLSNKDGSPMAEPEHRALAGKKVAYAGEPIAAVVAESSLLAKDAAERIVVEYEELPAVVEVAAAIEPGAPSVWDEVPGNISFDWEIGDKAAVEAAFAAAAHRVTVDLIQNRLVPNAMEPRAAIGVYDAANDEHTLYVAHQSPHLARHMYCRYTLGIPEHKLRVVAPDVGGGFGSKGFQYAEDVLVLCAAKTTGRPVKWVGERSESFLSDAQARDHVTHAEMALDADGRVLGIRVDTVANLGAYISLFGAAIPTIFHATMLTGAYDVPALYAEVKGVFTNTVPTDAYRGAGRPEACYTVERLMDAAAEATDLGPVEIRRRNFIPKDAFPYATPAGLVYDSGDYDHSLSQTLRSAGFDDFEGRRAEAAARGKLRGIGICSYVEVAGPGPSPDSIAMGSRMPYYEVATVRVNPDATVTVLTGSHSHGQGHETSFAQVVSEYLAVPFDDIEIVHGDTSRIPFGVGTFGSRSLSVGASAVLNGVRKVIAKATRIAAHMLESAPEDIEYIDGYFKVMESDRILAFKDVVHMAYLPGNYPLDELEPGLEETCYYDPPNFTFPSGCHCCEVEIDPETGVMEICNYNVSDDFGVIVNPMIVEGQVHGGLAQGIGQALMENTVFDPDSGQLVTGSFLDYCVPRADDLPTFGVEAIEGFSPSNPLGVKGCGEAGAIGAPAAVMSAVLDALRPAGVSDLTMPATAQKIWKAIHEGPNS
jgi:aerobic carbon-monoxide dehydrogenase large subunit